MSASDIAGLRLQCLANARLLLRAAPSPETTRALPSSDTSATLVASALGQRSSTTTGTTTSFSDLDVVVFGDNSNYTAAVMTGLTPAIEGATASAPEIAIRKLLTATCELLKDYMPKVGSHQRNIHGGGVFDEDVISSELIEATKRSS